MDSKESSNNRNNRKRWQCQQKKSAIAGTTKIT